MSHGQNDFDVSTAVPKRDSWWRRRIHQFTGLEVEPSQVIRYGLRGDILTWPCESKFASCWIVYGFYHCQNGIAAGHENLVTFSNEADARRFYERLLLLFPHLRGDSHA